MQHLRLDNIWSRQFSPESPTVQHPSQTTQTSLNTLYLHQPTSPTSDIFQRSGGCYSHKEGKLHMRKKRTDNTCYNKDNRVISSKHPIDIWRKSSDKKCRAECVGYWPHTLLAHIGYERFMYRMLAILLYFLEKSLRWYLYYWSWVSLLLFGIPKWQKTILYMEDLSWIPNIQFSSDFFL